jgi:biopolymer transport protein ExbD
MKPISQRVSWLLATSLCALAGCYAPNAVVHAELDIAADGAYTLNGQPVPSAELGGALSGLAQRQKVAILDIHASPKAQMNSIQLATQAAKQAQIRVAFAEEVPPR